MNATENIQELLRQLMQAIIDNAKDLRIEAKELPGRVDFKASVHIDDQGKVIGKQGAHVKAMQHLLGVIGCTSGTQYKLEILNPEVARRGLESEKRHVTQFDPSEAGTLLFDILDAVLGNDQADVEVIGPGDGPTLAFVFRINPGSVNNYERLVTPFDPTGRGTPQTVIASIGTLFRAYARKEGVEFSVEVPPL